MQTKTLSLLSLSTAVMGAKAQSGCGTQLPDGQTTGNMYQVTIPTDEDPDRFALISIPPNYSINTKTQVILSFHGGDRTAQDQSELDGLTDPAINSDKIVVYPQADGSYWEGSPDVDSDDVGFTNTILDHLEQTYCIDTNRIFATGKSEGGGMCGVLACNNALSQRIAAFAPVSGAFYDLDVSSCNPNTVKITCNAGRPKIPFLEFHGGDDTTIAYNGEKSRKGACLPSIPDYIQQWAARDGLSTTNTTSSITSDTVLFSFGAGADQGLVEQVFDASIGHDWPSTTANSDNQRDGHSPASFNATPMILKFFSRYSL